MIKVEGNEIEVDGTISGICEEFAMLASSLVIKMKEEKSQLANLDDGEVLFYIIKAGMDIANSKE